MFKLLVCSVTTNLKCIYLFIYGLFQQMTNNVLMLVAKVKQGSFHTLHSLIFRSQTLLSGLCCCKRQATMQSSL